MKILVIDDSAVHLKAAQVTLLGHEVTLCSSHDNALNLLRFQDNNKEFLYWDMVLCDLLMPAGANQQGSRGMKFVGEEMAVGWSLALEAAKRGAKFVAVVTDTNHHNHPASAMLDAINRHIFKIDGAKMLMTNRINHIEVVGYESEGKDWGDIMNRLLE